MGNSAVEKFIFVIFRGHQHFLKHRMETENDAKCVFRGTNLQFVYQEVLIFFNV